MTKFGSNATNSSATEINLEIFNLNFLATELEMEWKDNSSYRSNAWVRCASGNVLGELLDHKKSIQVISLFIFNPIS